MPQPPTTTVPPENDDVNTMIDSFVEDELDGKEHLELRLHDFVEQQQHHSRPVALVTSGGTVAHLEVNSVRCLDNFSTGLRGAISVEELLHHGYAVIHLYRKGSASPYARLLYQHLGVEQANYAIPNDCLDTLWSWMLLLSKRPDDDNTASSSSHQPKPRKVITWWDMCAAFMTGNYFWKASSNVKPNNNGHRPDHVPFLLLPDGGGGSKQWNLRFRERFTVQKEGRLLSIPFVSVEEYLAKLRICSMALRPCGKAAMLYLAAAVSDFYIPKSKKSQHKISSSSSLSQARDGGNDPMDHTTDHKVDHDDNDKGLVLKLYPVPKVLGLVRTTWSPEALVISFKLETDPTVLRQKAERAIRRYDCHMVIGNILATRYQQVWVLVPPSLSSPTTSQVSVEHWPMLEISASGASDTSNTSLVNDGDDDPDACDALEKALIRYVVQSHTDYSGMTVMARKPQNDAQPPSCDNKHQNPTPPLLWQLWRPGIFQWATITLASIVGYYGISKLSLLHATRSSGEN